jgi:hypothetical protein
VRQLLADKISGNQVGIWLLAPEHLRLGTWDLLCAWRRPRMRLNAFNIGDFSRSAAVSNAYPITVRNGTISNFGFGVWAENVGQGVIAYLSDITVSNIVFNTAQNSAEDSTGVDFDFVNSSTISNCSFNVGDWGIRDLQSQGGNSYNQNRRARRHLADRRYVFVVFTTRGCRGGGDGGDGGNAEKAWKSRWDWG